MANLTKLECQTALAVLSYSQSKLQQLLKWNKVLSANKNMENTQNKLPSDLTSDLKKRLKTLSGQINGIVRMLNEGKDPEQINIQFKSVDKGLQKAHFLLLDEVYRKALALNIVNAAESCPGNCGNEDKIEYLKNQFPHFKVSEITEKLTEIQMIENSLREFNEKKS